MLKWKKIVFVFFVAIICIVVFSVDTARAVVVDFPDSNLEAAVSSNLKIPIGYITDTDMLSLIRLAPMDSQIISNIQGLEYATNLTDLRLGSYLCGATVIYPISDLSPLAGLTNLTSLYLWGNEISDISPLSDLTNLTNLHLSGSSISNLSPLSGLTNLTYLGLDSNSINDLSPLSGLTNLTNLSLSSNSINDLSPLSGLTNLTTLYLGDNEISDLSPLSGLTNLTTLQLGGIRDCIGFLVGSNQISDVSPLSGLTNLTNLDLSYNQIEVLDLHGSNLSSLSVFDIADNPVTEVCLSNATLSQSTFDVLMNGGFINSGTGIAELEGIVKLDMSGVDFSGISDFSEMFTMDDLEILLLPDATNLDGTDVVAFLSELDSLKWLDVVGLWEGFDESTQDSLLAWDSIAGNFLLASIPGDANYDGRVDGSDVTILASNWQLGIMEPPATWEMGDFNGDGRVDGSDVTILAGNWQAGVSSAPITVPEPATLSLLMMLILAVLAVLRRKR